MAMSREEAAKARDPERRWYRGPRRKGYSRKSPWRASVGYQSPLPAPGSKLTWAIIDSISGEDTGARTWYDLEQKTWVLANAGEEPVAIDFNPGEAFDLIRITRRMTLRLIRKMLRMTSRELADVLGISCQLLGHWEKKEYMPEDKLQLLTEILRRRKHMDRKKK